MEKVFSASSVIFAALFCFVILSEAKDLCFVILSEAKDLFFSAAGENRSFAALRMTILF